MARKLKRIVLVSGTFHPLHSKAERAAREVAEELGVDFEVKIEDYTYLAEYGVKDEFGSASIPQVFAEFDDGTVKPVLWEFPLNERLKPDIVKAKEQIKSRIEKAISGG